MGTCCCCRNSCHVFFSILGFLDGIGSLRGVSTIAIRYTERAVLRMLKVTNVNRVIVSEEKKEEVKNLHGSFFFSSSLLLRPRLRFFPLLSFFHPKILLLSPTAATWWLQLAASTQEGPGGRRTGEWCGCVCTWASSTRTGSSPCKVPARYCDTLPAEAYTASGAEIPQLHLQVTSQSFSTMPEGTGSWSPREVQS